MSRKKLHLYQDVFVLLVSIGVAIMLVKSGIAEQFIISLGDLHLFGIVLAGMFFTSIFTTAPSVALLSQFAESTPLFMLAFLGGLGAVIGDYVIFIFVKDRIAADLNYLLSLSGGKKRYSKIFKIQIFRFFMPFLGGLIIASPLPDELGVAMLGISKINSKKFFIISFLFNAIGILAVGLLARIIVGI